MGKTALLPEFHRIAAGRGYEVVILQAMAGRDSSIDGLLAGADRRISEKSSPWQSAKKGFERTAGFQLGAAGFTAGLAIAPGEVRPLPDASLFAMGSPRSPMRCGAVRRTDGATAEQHSESAAIRATSLYESGERPLGSAVMLLR